MPQETGKVPTPAVVAISELDITGNVVPREWLLRLKMPNGSHDAIGALVLAEIVFWYRWTEVRDEGSQFILRRERRFKADKLQKSYQQLSTALGFSRQQVRSAIERLEHGGYLTKELRHFTAKDGTVLHNVMYLEPVPEAIKRLTYAEVKEEDLSAIRGVFSPEDQAMIDDRLASEDADQSVMGNTPPVTRNTPSVAGNTPSLSTDHTYTKNTTQITTENTTKIPYLSRGAAKDALSRSKPISKEKKNKQNQAATVGLARFKATRQQYHLT